MRHGTMRKHTCSHLRCPGDGTNYHESRLVVVWLPAVRPYLLSVLYELSANIPIGQRPATPQSTMNILRLSLAQSGFIYSFALCTILYIHVKLNWLSCIETFSTAANFICHAKTWNPIPRLKNIQIRFYFVYGVNLTCLVERPRLLTENILLTTVPRDVHRIRKWYNWFLRILIQRIKLDKGSLCLGGCGVCVWKQL